MSSDMDIVFQEENDWRRMEDTLDVQAEMQAAQDREIFRDQADTDNAVLKRVERGETTRWDALYLRARLSVRD